MVFSLVIQASGPGRLSYSQKPSAFRCTPATVAKASAGLLPGSVLHGCAQSCKNATGGTAGLIYKSNGYAPWAELRTRGSGVRISPGAPIFKNSKLGTINGNHPTCCFFPVLLPRTNTIKSLGFLPTAWSKIRCSTSVITAVDGKLKNLPERILSLGLTIRESRIRKSNLRKG